MTYFDYINSARNRKRPGGQAGRYNSAMSLVKKVRNIRHVGHGLKIMWLKEVQFPSQITLGLLLIVSAFAVHASSTELLILSSAVLLAIAAEVLNTAFEVLCDKLHPAHDAEIGKVKDLAATFVVFASLPALIAFGVIVLPRLLTLL